MPVSSRRIITIALSAGALAVAPALLTTGGPIGALIGTTALAQGNGGGHGGGNGGGHGGGHGNGGGHAGGIGAGSAADHSNGHGAVASARGFGGFVGGLLGTGHKDKSGAASGHATHMAGINRGKSLEHQQLQSLRNKAVPVPTEVAEVKEKNLHAKLGWLNSLQRNYHAYLNAKDPKFAPIQAYVLTYAKTEIDLADAKATLASAEQAYSAISPYDAAAPIDPTDPTAVANRLTDLQAVDTSTLTAEQLSAYTAEMDALNAIEDASNQVAADENTLDDPNALPDALETATNSTEIDPDVLGWTSSVLSTKIDQVKAALQTQSASTDTVATSSTTVSE